jgi:AcrR family transcriptional regulator
VTATRRRTAPGGAGAERLADVAVAALACFSEGGYRLTQIAHVAERLGVSVGSIYRYVESKEALFHLAVLKALDRLGRVGATPLKIAGLDSSARLIREEVRDDPYWPTLERGLGYADIADVRRETEAIAGELYDAISRRAALIILLDHCARDIPTLAGVFDEAMRGRLMGDLMAWIGHRRLLAGQDQDQVAALARGGVEAVAWLAKTRLGDPTAAHIAEPLARAAAVRIFTASLCPQPG